MNDLTVFVSGWPVDELILVIHVVPAVKVFGQLFQIVTRRVPRHALVLRGACLRRVLATLLVTVVTTVCAANARSRTPNKSAADLTRGRSGVVVLLESVGSGE